MEVRKPSRLLGKVAEEDVAHDAFEDSVAEKLESLVVERLRGPLAAGRAARALTLAAGRALLAAVGQRLVGEGYAVDFDVVGVETQYVVENRKKLLVLAEGELHPVE